MTGVWVGVRWAALLALSAGFGAVDAWCYRQGGLVGAGWLHWAANVAAVWLLLAFVCGWVAGSRLGAVCAGLVGTWLALWVFYRVTGETNWQVAGKWVELGLFSGPVCGWLGHRWARHRWVGAVLASAFVLEPVGWRLWMGFLPGYTYPVFGTEVLIGVAVIALVLGRAGSRRADAARQGR